MGVGVGESDTGEYERAARAKFCAGGATESGLSDGRALVGPAELLGRAELAGPAELMGPAGTLPGLLRGGGAALGGPGRWVTSVPRLSAMVVGSPGRPLSGVRSTTASGPR